MVEWGVTNLGYEILQKTGLDKRIEEQWNDIAMSLMPHGAFLEEWEIDDVLKKDLPPERRSNIDRWLREKREYDREPRDLFMISGAVTDKILSKEESNDPKRFGVENITQLDGLLAAFCLTKDSDNPLGSRGYYTWRSEEFKTKIYGDTHGDLQVSQVKTVTTEKQLFGKLPQDHINVSYENWPVLAATAIKYADTVGVKIPAVDNWQKFMRRQGWDGEIARPGGWGVGYDRFVFDYSRDIIAQLPDKTDVRKVKKMFFGGMRPNASNEIFYLPVIDPFERLVFFSSGGGNAELAPYGEPVKCRPVVYIQKSDASHLFRGAVHGIMTHQSRTRPELLAYMLWEYDQMRAGRSEEEIRKDSDRFKIF